MLWSIFSLEETVAKVFDTPTLHKYSRRFPLPLYSRWLATNWESRAHYRVERILAFRHDTPTRECMGALIHLISPLPFACSCSIDVASKDCHSGDLRATKEVLSQAHQLLLNLSWLPRTLSLLLRLGSTRRHDHTDRRGDDHKADAKEPPVTDLELPITPCTND
ncbi:hypothetical protein FNV43_RR19757 [Rhamnella rubrinervis]|uniref:Uncharacterized protein n=1 Tax=Rhamnella rubrinervis TaxID=2594499 RepID=A0A8K0GSQ6_9ROSA|nr:hypothetical protein FNV43_RR19757 [Rhamnella rubrinervis]